MDLLIFVSLFCYFYLFGSYENLYKTHFLSEDMKTQARLVIEIMGRPADHVKKMLSEIVIRISSEKGVKLLNKQEYSPKKLKDSESLYTAFAEIEVETESLEKCFWLAFAYMPSNVEIISPISFKVTTDQINALIGNLIARLHNYDSLAKKLVADREILIKQANYLKSVLAEHGVNDPFAKLREQREAMKKNTKKSKGKKKRKSG